MSETDIRAAAGEMVLDPFVYQPGKASAIQGLGGESRHDDPGYAFHTDYVLAAEGPCNFSVRFTGLVAKTGTLQLRVHLMLEDDGNRLVLGNSVRIQFNRLIQLGGDFSIRFEGFHRVRYALYGSIIGATDATADDLLITLDRPGSAESAPGDGAASLRNSDYGKDATRGVPILISSETPTFRLPVCQAATRSQLREAPYKDWLAKLGLGSTGDRWNWSTAYVLQCLKVYGMLVPGARGLGLGTGAQDLVNLLRSTEIDAVARTSDGMPDPQGEALINFDFLWSIDTLIVPGGEEPAVLALDAMRSLRPGGMAVHVLPFLPGLDQRDRGQAAGVARRADIERLGLMMISRGFEVAQIKVACDHPVIDEATGGSPKIGAFGMIFRKATVIGG